MGVYILRRLGLGMVALLGVLVVSYLLIHLAPIDPAHQYAGMHASREQLAAAEKLLGLDQPVYVQIVTYAKNFLTGNWGVSLQTKRSVAMDIRTTLPYTVELVVLSMLLSCSIGIPLGVLSATRKGRLADHFSRLLAVSLIAIPTFWLALGLQYVFSGQLDLLPLSGAFSYDVMYDEPIRSVTGIPLIDALLTGNLTAFWDHAAHLVLPVIALTGMSLGIIQRLTRASMLEVLDEDYILAARSYGLPERAVLRHGLKNSVGPLATIVALTIAWLLVNTFLVESIFAWPGMGNYIVTAISTIDYPVIMAVTLVSAISYLVFNLLADVVIALDPRVRLRE